MSQDWLVVRHPLIRFAAALLLAIGIRDTVACAFDTTGLAMWLDAGDIDGDGNLTNNPAYLSSVDLWFDKSGKGNHAFVAPVGDPPDGTAAGFPGASGGVTHAEIIGPLPPAPVLIDHNDPLDDHALSPNGLPAVRFNTCNDAPQFPGCNVTPPAYPNQTGLMTNYHAHPDPTAIPFDLGKPAVPDLTVVTVVRPWFIEVGSYHPIWTFDGNLGGHNRSLGIAYDFNGKNGLHTGHDVFYEDSLDKWMIVAVVYDYDGTESDPNPQSQKVFINGPDPMEVEGPESVQGSADAPMTIGWFPQNYVQGNNISMNLSEFIVFERSLTDADINALGYELAQKYGISTTFTSAGVAGDYNNDGEVDAADYVVWRDNLQTTNSLPNDPIGGQIGQDHYTQWRSNFGRSASSAAATASSVAVPEPSLLLLLTTAAIGMLSFGPRMARRNTANAMRVMTG